MDVATGQGYIAKAFDVTAESQAYIANIRTELEKKGTLLKPKGRPATYAERVAFGHGMRRILEPVITYLFSKAEEMIALVEMALEVEAIAPLGEECWQTALVGLASERELVSDFCTGKLRATLHRHRGMEVGWPASWDKQCDEVLDRMDDLAETIAIGLNEELRGEIERRIASAKNQ
jgi:hypothetical protein